MGSYVLIAHLFLFARHSRVLCFLWFFVCFLGCFWFCVGGCGGLLWFFACFRHADVLACFQWFCGVCLVLVCVLVGFGVSLSLAAQRGWFSSVEVDEPAGVVVV
ncbi:hypothetical protein ACLD55_05175 [Gardnerella vaginalis]|uniref:hypothetical protein n=1 Tax=Gardnerella vaginalis TaxID=2702 RepID=UPI000C9ED686|nr:hypothetical protein [Gardnerella vaginalis]MDK7260189.1 hypothetical protein [Gardnerella vaginalis]